MEIYNIHLSHNIEIDNFLRKQLKYAKPPIRGEVTQGKLKWRGIRLITQREDFNTVRYWLEQRGERIGEGISITHY